MTPSAVVITVSTRAFSGVYTDRSGPILVQGLVDLGFEVGDPVIVVDGEPVAGALREALSAAPDLVLTTGVTGLGPDDRTPELTRPLLDREIPQLASAIARHGADNGVPTAVLSRGLAGVAGTTLVVNLPGSTGGVRDGLAVLAPVLMHAISQLRGGDH